MDNPSSLNSISQKISQLGKSIQTHPFIFTALLCFLCGIFTFGSENFISAQSILFMTALGCTAMILAFSFSHSDTNKKHNSFPIYLLFVLFGGALGLMTARLEHKALFLFTLGIAVCLFVFVRLLFNKQITTERLLIILFVVGFLLRLTYVLYTVYSIRQHDVSSFGKTSGHAGYIEYLYKNMTLPDFDVRTRWQFYHPPLHHAIAAIWMRFLTTFGVSYSNACESVQILTLFYSSCCMILSCKIFKALHLKDNGLIVAFAIIAFHPTFIIFAGSINNDILSVAFMLGAILNSINWYYNQTMVNILKIALCVGLGMMTKLSAWMVAPAIALMFAVVFFSKLRCWKKYIAQFAAFLAVCAPLGLWWSIRNLILWKVPVSYVPLLSETSEQYIGFHSVAERLFNFDWKQFEWVYTQFGFYEGTYFEYNPTIALLKTAMFGERVNDVLFPGIAIFGVILFWSSVALVLIGVFAMIYFFIKKVTKSDTVIKFFLALLYFVILLSYYYFCIAYPHTCTQNIRYASPLIVLGAFFIGTIPLAFKSKKIYSKILRGLLYGLTALFCTSSAVTYFIVGI